MKNRGLAQNLRSRSIKREFSYLFEQGLFDEEAGEKKEDKPAEGEEDKPEGEAEDKPAEGEEDKPAEEKKEDKGKEEKKDKSPKPTTVQKAAAEDSVRTEIQKYLIRANADAVAALASEDPDYVKKESSLKSLKHVYRRHLWEAADTVNLDLQVFASQVYNLIANWKNMFDMPAIILNNAYVFLQDEYQDEKIVDKFKEVMRQEYPDVKIPAPPGDEDVGPDIPFAPGAKSAAG